MPRAEPLQLKAAACQTFAVYQENHGDPLHVRRSVTDIYTHRESLVRNHEPCAKVLGNKYILQIRPILSKLEAPCSLLSIGLVQRGIPWDFPPKLPSCVNAWQASAVRVFTVHVAMCANSCNYEVGNSGGTGPRGLPLFDIY